MSEETKMVEALRAYAKDQGGWHNIDDTCEEAAVMIERLVRERKEAQEDESSMLLIAHMNGAAQGRRAGLEEAAKIVHQLGKDRGVPGAHINAMVAAIRARMGEA